MVDLNLILGQQWGLEKVVWVRRIENAQQMLEISALLKLLLFFYSRPRSLGRGDLCLDLNQCKMNEQNLTQCCRRSLSMRDDGKKRLASDNQHWDMRESLLDLFAFSHIPITHLICASCKHGTVPHIVRRYFSGYFTYLVIPLQRSHLQV